MGLLFLVWFWRCLPEPLFSTPISPALFSSNGALLSARVATDEQWRFEPRSHVPDKFSRALVRFEDKRFYSHLGVDPIAVLRALWLNLTNQSVVSGASTISMQVIRIARGNQERTIPEKLYEMLLALRLELALSKEEILALYAAYAPFGGNVVGLEAASWRYFGGRPEQLSWAQAAMLAVLPNSPGLIHLTKNRDRLRDKRNALLTQLANDGEFDALTERLAKAEPLPRGVVAMPTRSFHLLHTLTARHGAGRFDSTLDHTIQFGAEGVVAQQREFLEAQGVDNLAVLVIDNESFDVLAYVGNTQWSATGGRGHAVDMIQSERSTGSILKPFLYAVMLETGELLPTTLVLDIPTKYEGYSPKNYDREYRGAIPAREALARSLNIPAVRMLREFGTARFYEFLKKAGVTTLHRTPREYGLTLILGGAEARVWDIANLYANMADIAERGTFGAGQPYKKIRVLKSQSTETEQARGVSPGASWLTIQALVDVNRPNEEAHWRRFSSSQRIAWKTGTSFGQRDAWAVGSTAKYTVAVWAGNATGEGRAGLTGTNSAAPVMFDVFNRLGHSSWFRMPEGDLKYVTACEKDGFKPTNECVEANVLSPVNAHFEKTSPYYKIVHLSEDGQHQVHSQCHEPSRMKHESRMVLSPLVEYFYKQRFVDYKRTPPFREDCLESLSAAVDHNPLQIAYPDPGAKIYIPVDLDSQKGRVILEALHRDQSATVYWHLDREFVGETQKFHQQALDIRSGQHSLTIVDDQGNERNLLFEILSQ